MNISAIAQDLVPLLGGKENIVSAAHCATRLRLVLADDSKVNKAAIDKLEGVKGCFSNAGQIQVIFGTGLVNKVYAEFVTLTGTGTASKAELTDMATATPSFRRCSSMGTATKSGRPCLATMDR